jgi:low affinity Fe/Cu permease
MAAKANSRGATGKQHAGVTKKKDVLLAMDGGGPTHARTGASSSLRDKFRIVARRIALIAGEPWVFGIALASLILWGLTGPLFHYSDTWQLVINTGTTIVTFLMVFLIQNTQNHDQKALHLKLDELLRAIKPARTSLVDLEDLSDEELDKLQHEFERLVRRAGKKGRSDEKAAA